MRHYEKKDSKIFYPEKPRDNVSSGPAVALDGLGRGEPLFHFLLFNGPDLHHTDAFIQAIISFHVLYTATQNLMRHSLLWMPLVDVIKLMLCHVCLLHRI